MKTKKRTKYLAIVMFLITMAGFNNLQAQVFDEKDINGTWERSDGVRISIGGTGLFDIGGSALIFAVGNSGWSTKVVQYNYKFQNIKHKENNTWAASNYAFSKERDTFIPSGNALLIMNKEKSEFTCSGFTYFRKSLIK